MNTNKPCFASSNALMLWQEENCLCCKKAVWYNQRLKKMPQYRCAVQRQIEEQSAGEECVTDRTYNATREKHCPFFKPKDENVEQKAEVLDFSKGESLISETSVQDDENFTQPQQKAEEQPRKCVKSDAHPDAALLKLSRETGVQYEALKDAERRMFETITAKAELPPIFHEDKFKKQIKDDTYLMLETFTWKENMMIAFVPLVISHLAWIYAEKVRSYCAEQRIPETVKLSRAVKHVWNEYQDSLKKDLNARHIERINKQTEQFHNLYANDFTILWYCVDSEYKKEYPDDDLRNMHVDAFVSILMCRFLVDHNKRMDKIIEAKLGFAQSIKNPYINKLETCMDAYCGNYTIMNTPNIDACLRILQKNINDIDFEVDDSEPK